MTAHWVITPLSIQDDSGSYVTVISESEQPYTLQLDAEEAIDGATAELFRIKQDHELTGPSVDAWGPIAVGEGALEVTPNGTVATILIAGHVRHETYIVVVLFDATVGEPFSRTRIVECVA